MNSFLSKLLILFIASSLNAQAYFLDYVKIQHAGEIGTYALGIGKNVSKNYSVDFFHGRVPLDIGGEEIDTYAVKNNFNLFELTFDPVVFHTYCGIAIYHVTGLDYQSSRHSSYPEDYYRYGSIRGLLYLGEKVRFGKGLKKEFYFEAGLNDIVITNYINNSNVIDPLDYVSLALGFGYKF